MIEPRIERQHASDGYSLHVKVWPVRDQLVGRVMILHGVQSHGGWYHSLGRTLAESGYEAHFPDRRGSGANVDDRGHTPSASRLILDISERLQTLRESDASVPVVLVGISWGGKTAVITAAEHPSLVDSLALICPGLQPRVGVTFRERMRIAFAYLTNRRKLFPIPLSNPSLFTDNLEGQRFIADDPLSLRNATAGLLAASSFIDRRARGSLRSVRQPVLLMLAGQDRIVDNLKTREYFTRFASVEKTIIEYPDGHHTLEFENDPTAYTHDLIRWLDALPKPNP